MGNDIDLGQDISNVERGKTSDIIPKGEYLTEIQSCTKDQKDGKAPSIKVELGVVGDTEGGKWVGSSFVQYLSLSENALWNVAAFLDAVFGQSFKGRSFPVDKVIGKRLAVRTHIEVYNDRDQVRVNRWIVASKFSGDKKPDAAGGNAVSGSTEVLV
jgi:hypothetical protein